MQHCPLCRNLIVPQGWVNIEDNGWQCGSCYEDLSDWWLPEDYAWINIHPEAFASLEHTKSLNFGLSNISDADWDSCIQCGEDPYWCERYGTTHPYTPISECLVYDDQIKIMTFINPDYEISLPASNFYAIERHSTEQFAPMDCRACKWYQTPQCIPLRNAIDDMENVIAMLEHPWEHQREYQISPCNNFKQTENMGFGTTVDLMKWAKDMEAYYNIQMSTKVNWSTAVGTYYFEGNRKIAIPTIYNGK